MSIPRMSPMTKEEEGQRGPQVDEGRYYRGEVVNVDFFRDKAGLAVGSKPGKPRADGSVSNPHGAMRIHIDVKLDEEYGFDDPIAVISFPYPWSDREEESYPWIGDAESGHSNKFTDEQVVKYMRHIRTGDQMPNAMAVIAKRFGYVPFVVDSKTGLPVPQVLDFGGLMMGKRVMVGRVKMEGRQGASWDIQPGGASESQGAEKPVRQYVSELFAALVDAKMGNGAAFTEQAVLAGMSTRPQHADLVGKTTVADLSDEQAGRLATVLVASCNDRKIVVPSKYVETQVEGL